MTGLLCNDMRRFALDVALATDDTLVRYPGTYIMNCCPPWDDTVVLSLFVRQRIEAPGQHNAMVSTGLHGP